MESKHHPQTIAVLFEGNETPEAPVAVHVDGQSMDWNDAPVAFDDQHRLTYAGTLYQFDGYIGQRRINHMCWQWGARYRILTGWRILTDYRVEGGELAMLPLGTFPTDDRAQAEASGLHTALLYMANGYDADIQVHLVWQDGDDYSEPHAIFDGRKHTRAEALRAVVDNKTLTWDWVKEEATVAGASPAPDGNPDQDDQDDTDADATDTPAAQYALVVRYKGTGATVMPLGKNTASGELVTWQDADGNDIAGMAQSVYESRMWLKTNGYEPDFPQWRWLDRGAGPRRRVEVYHHTGQVIENVDYAYLAQQAQANQAPEDGPVTQEMRDQWIAAARAKKIAAGLDPDLPITLQIENYGCDAQSVGRDHAFNYVYR